MKRRARRAVVAMLVLAVSLLALFGCERIIITRTYEVLVADFTVLPEGNLLTGQWVEFDASVSRIEEVEETVEIQPKGIIVEPLEILGYRWDFGDRTRTDIMPSPLAYHKYQDDGIYTVRLTVFASQGYSAGKTKVIEIQNRSPVADFVWSPCTVFTNSETQGIVPTPTPSNVCLRFDGQFSHDPDGWIAGYQWSCEGEYWGQGPVIQCYLQRGSYYWVRLDITDDDGATDNISQLVVVQ